jgi:tRNA dimethylallyltransferase
LNIGVARPSPGELKEVKHHFIASHSIHQEVNAGDFEKYALEKTAELFKEHDVIIMSGGTGLYIKAFCEGMDEIPSVDPAVRAKIVREYEEKGLGWLQEQVKKKDPNFFKTGEIKNPQRLMRALEVVESSAKSILEFRKGIKTGRDFNIVKIGLELSKESLHQNINARVDKMIEDGLVDEVKSLLSFKNNAALKTLGYSEIFDWLDKKISWPDAVERIKIATRQYAKRQMTWFKKDKDIKWFAPREIEKIKEHLVDVLL